MTTFRQSGPLTRILGAGAMALVLLATTIGCGARGSTPTGAVTAEAMTVAQREAMERAVDRVRPALVRIHIVEPSFYEGRERKFVASGSGAIITPEGHVITNHHVAGKAIRISCTLPNREEIPAILVGTDPATDIAVIKLMPPEPMTFPVAEFGDSDRIRVGDVVLALGSPLGLSQSVTMGIVSNTEMIMPSLFRGMDLELDGESVGELVRWIGHDATIFGGNSGGPLVTMDGDIIGVNEISLGLAGAIPGNLARAVAMELIERGNVRRAYVGVALQPRLRTLQHDKGVTIGTILKESPAKRAGLQSGDLLVSLGGEPVDVRFREELPALNNRIANLPIDKPVAIEIIRDGERMTLELVPEQRQPALPRPRELRNWGMAGRSLSLFTQLRLARDTTQGVLVTSTRPGGPLAKAKPEIRSGDVIISVNQQPIEDLDALIEMTRDIVEGHDSLVDVLVEFERNSERMLTVVGVGIEDLDDPGAEIRRAWVPIETQVLTAELARGLGIEGTRGVRVTRVYPDRPDELPFEVGDIILAIDGDPVEASQLHDAEVFRTMVRQYRLNLRPEFTVLRNGERLTLESPLMETPARRREMRLHRELDFEFTVREATWFDRQEPTTAGVNVSVIVDSVPEGGWASLADLRVGDIILEVGRQSVQSLDELQGAMESVRDARPDRVLFRVRRGISDIFLEVEPMWDVADSPDAATAAHPDWKEEL